LRKELDTATQQHLRPEIVLQLQADLQAARTRIMGLENEVQSGRIAQQSLHQSTLDIMKSSQRQASKMAFEHSQQSLVVLRDELRAEYDTKLRSISQTYKQQIMDLETEIWKLKSSSAVAELETKYSDLETQYQALATTHSSCVRRMERLSQTSSPSVVELDRLTSRILELESSASVRESMLTRSLQSETERSELEKNNLLREIKSKDWQIKRFQTELHSIVEALTLLKKQRHLH
ncbi:hypothetical protein HDU91_004091, partial [Kappamyces sp. JEL0680]